MRSPLRPEMTLRSPRSPRLWPGLVGTALGLLLGGCGAAQDGAERAGTGGSAGTTAGGTAGQGGSTASGSGSTGPAVFEKSERYLTGRFDSSLDAQQNPSHFAISLVICPVDVPELGEHVLYVEQAKLDQLNAPYRQRLYVVEPGADPSAQARSRVFELDRPKDFIGLCDDPSATPVSAGDADEKAGCAVTLDYDAASDTFHGGTQGKDCPSALAGASYATSDVTLTATELRSWDRGFDGNDTQVWGAADGPYVFTRKTPLGN